MRWPIIPTTRRRLGRPPLDSRALGRRGNAAIEFGIIAPVMIVLMIMVMELGIQLMVGAMLDYGVRMSSRWGVTGEAAPAGRTREQHIQSLITGASGDFLQAARLNLTVSSYGAWPANGGLAGAGTRGAGAASTVVTYTATYRQPYMTGLPASLGMPASVLHRTATIVNNEPYPTTP